MGEKIVIGTRASSLALGLALAQPERSVLAITGDGEQLMGIGSLATIAVQQPWRRACCIFGSGVISPICSSVSQPVALTTKQPDSSA